MAEFEKGYEQGYKDGVAGAALPNVNDNGDKIDGYSYVYKTDSRGEPYIHIDSVRSMLKKAADVHPIKRGKWEENAGYGGWGDTIYQCSECSIEFTCETGIDIDWNYCPYCGARMKQED